MEGPLTFRPAAKADASALAVLVDIAGEGLPAYLWSTLKAPGQSILEVGRERAARETAASPTATPLSPRSEARSPPASSATGSTIPTISAASNRSLRSCGLWSCSRRRRQAPGTSMCSRPSLSSAAAGIGMALLGIAEEKAARRGAPALSVIVAGENEPRRGSTQAAGYQTRAAEPIFAFPGCPHGGDWVLMVKSLPADA